VLSSHELVLDYLSLSPIRRSISKVIRLPSEVAKKITFEE